MGKETVRRIVSVRADELNMSKSLVRGSIMKAFACVYERIRGCMRGCVREWY